MITVESRASVVPPMNPSHLRPALTPRVTKPTGTLALLRQHALFAGLDLMDFNDVCLRARPLALESRQMLFRHGEPANRFFVVVRGSVKLFRLTWHGTEKVIDSVRPGQIAGESVMVASEPRYQCYAEALEATELLAITNDRFRALMLSRTDYTQALLAWLAASLDGRLEDIEVLTTQNAKDRVIGYLRQLLPDPTAASADIELPLPKALLASRLAMQPETFSRVLSSLRKCGIMRMDRRRILIDDVPAMLRYAE